MRFPAVLELHGKTATGFQVPAAVVAALGSGKRPPAPVTINGYTYSNIIAPMGGVFMLGVSVEHRAGAGVAAGDELEVELALDTEPRTVDVPPDLSDALATDPAAKAFYAGLSYSNQRRIVLGIEGVKGAETRQRRIASAVSRLAAGRL